MVDFNKDIAVSQLVKEPTCITEITSTLTNHIFTTYPDPILKSILFYDKRGYQSQF